MTLELQTPTPSVTSELSKDASYGLLPFFKGVGQTWVKITWPTLQRLGVQVAITISVTALITLLIWGLDNLYRVLIHTFALRGA